MRKIFVSLLVIFSSPSFGSIVYYNFTGTVERYIDTAAYNSNTPIASVGDRFNAIFQIDTTTRPSGATYSSFSSASQNYRWANTIVNVGLYIEGKEIVSSAFRNHFLQHANYANVNGKRVDYLMIDIFGGYDRSNGNYYGGTANGDYVSGSIYLSDTDETAFDEFRTKRGVPLSLNFDDFEILTSRFGGSKLDGNGVWSIDGKIDGISSDTQLSLTKVTESSMLGLFSLVIMCLFHRRV